jgi:UDPglucose 6-dehydrogenase
MCVESNQGILSDVSSGKIPIFEPELENLVTKCIQNQKLQFTDQIKDVLEFAEVIFICVGTPQAEDGKADLSQIDSVAINIAEHLNGYKLLVEKSTVPIGTHIRLKNTMSLHLKNKIDFEIACVPEFLREGNAVKDFFNPDRVILGIESENSHELLTSIYKDFKCPKIWTNPATAELIKYASNGFLAMKISYANMLADICEVTGADVESLIEGVGQDSRIGKAFINPGVGYGGSCLPKDVSAFIDIFDQHKINNGLLKEVESINQLRPQRIIAKLKSSMKNLENKKIAVWGLAFKPNTDDVRNAPSLEVVSRLIEEKATVNCHDPQATNQFKKVFNRKVNINFFDDMYESVGECDALIILTEWPEYLKANLDQLKTKMGTPLIIDGRGIFKLDEVQKSGFEYKAFGLTENNN